MVYRQKLRAQTAITEIHFIHPDIVFDLSASFSYTDDVFLCAGFSFFMRAFISVIVSFELKIMCCERFVCRLFGSVAVITDLWSLSNLIMTVSNREQQLVHGRRRCCCSWRGLRKRLVAIFCRCSRLNTYLKTRHVVHMKPKPQYTLHVPSESPLQTYESL